jgi:hypothetical protein
VSNATLVDINRLSFAERFGEITINRTFEDIFHDSGEWLSIREVIETYVCKHYKLEKINVEAALAHRDTINVLSNESNHSLTEMGMNPVSIACLIHAYRLHQ